jgi:hypothetical protein
MVNRSARDRLAESLRHFAAGRLTWREFIDRQASVASGAADPTISGILDRAWRFHPCDCDDDELGMTQCALCRDARTVLGRADRREVARWIVFLYSDLEYEWGWGRLEHALAWHAALAFGWFSAVLGFDPWIAMSGLIAIGVFALVSDGHLSRRLGLEGDQPVWPFFRQADLATTLERPRLFANRPA